jgi:hypothetical protein
MRTGSPRHALFKGRHRAEYAWFSISDALPFVSMDADRAGKLIVDAIRRGNAERVVSVPANVAALSQTLLPDVTAGVLASVNRLLPKANHGGGHQAREGRTCTSAWSPSLLTALGDRAAHRNNQTADSRH